MKQAKFNRFRARIQGMVQTASAEKHANFGNGREQVWSMWNSVSLRLAQIEALLARAPEGTIDPPGRKAKP